MTLILLAKIKALDSEEVQTVKIPLEDWEKGARERHLQEARDGTYQQFICVCGYHTSKYLGKPLDEKFCPMCGKEIGILLPESKLIEGE